MLPRYAFALCVVVLSLAFNPPANAQDAAATLTAMPPDLAASVAGEYVPRAELQAEDVVIDFTGWDNAAPQAVYEEFRAHYPNITINFVDLSMDETHARLAAALQAGSGAPCLSMLADTRAPQFFDSGLVDLSEMTAPYVALFPEAKWPKVTTTDGRVIGLPWDDGPVLMFYRRSLLETYGVDPASLTTWAGYLEAAQRLNEASSGEVKMLWSNAGDASVGTQATLVTDQLALSRQLGAGWFGENGEVILDSAANVRALKLLLALRQSGATLNDLSSGADEIASLVDGRVATFLMPASWARVPRLNAPESAGDWGVQLIPAWQDGGVRGLSVGGTSVALTEQCAAPEAAREFLRFWLLRVPGRISAYIAGERTENIFLPAADNEFFQLPDSFFGGDALFALTTEAAKQSPVVYESALFTLAQAELSAVLPSIIGGEVSAEAGLNAAANAVRAEAGQLEQPPVEEVALF